MDGKRIKGLGQLVEAMLLLKTEEECENFLFDLCSMTELQSISQRLQVAKMLREKTVYNDITAETGASTATISRVNRTLNFGKQGFEVILERLGQKNAKEK